MSDTDPRDIVHWYPMYVSYRCELVVKAALDKKNVECFVPMHLVYKRCNRSVVSRLEPAVHNLIFVHSSMNQLSQLKMYDIDCQYMQYMSFRSTVTSRLSNVITVPAARMEAFMKAMAVPDPNQRRTLLPYDEVLFGKEGRRIRFKCGDFEGVEGTVNRVNKNRSLVITLQYVSVLVIAIDHADDIEFLD